MTLDDKISRRHLLGWGARAFIGATLFPDVLIAQQSTVQTPPIQTTVVPPGIWVDNNHGFITIAQAGRYRADVVTGGELIGNKDTDYFTTTQWVRDRTRAYVCLNGSLFRNKDAASGLEVHNGLEVRPYVKTVGDGVLFTDYDGQLHIVTIDIFMRDFKREDSRFNVDDALQINLLSYYDPIADRIDLMYKIDENAVKLPRNLIGLTVGGNLVDVIFKNTNFTLGERYMRLQHKCVTVGALDGATSASAFDIKGQSSYIKGIDEEEIKVPNFIVLRPR